MLLPTQNLASEVTEMALCRVAATDASSTGGRNTWLISGWFAGKGRWAMASYLTDDEMAELWDRYSRVEGSRPVLVSGIEPDEGCRLVGA